MESGGRRRSRCDCWHDLDQTFPICFRTGSQRRFHSSSLCSSSTGRTTRINIDSLLLKDFVSCFHFLYLNWTSFEMSIISLAPRNIFNAIFNSNIKVGSRAHFAGLFLFVTPCLVGTVYAHCQHTNLNTFRCCLSRT